MDDRAEFNAFELDAFGCHDFPPFAGVGGLFMNPDDRPARPNTADRHIPAWPPPGFRLPEDDDGELIPIIDEPLNR